MAKTYGYVRVSSADQNESRQLMGLKKLGIPDKRIFYKSSVRYRSSGARPLPAKIESIFTLSATLPFLLLAQPRKFCQNKGVKSQYKKEIPC